MNFLLQLIGFASMAALSSSIFIDPDCIAMRKPEVKLHGTKTHITAWVGDSSDILILTLEYGKGHPYVYDIIEVSHKGILMKRNRENKKETRNQKTFTQSLAFGWLDLDFLTVEKYTFNITSHDEYHEFIGESNLRLKKFTAVGSNITVNCNSDNIYWEVMNGMTFIPLKPNGTNIFSLFSRSDFKPTLAADNSSIQLGTNDNTINDIQQYIPHYQRPLSRYEEHIVKIQCVAYHYCTYVLGNDEDHKIKKSFSKNYTSLSVNGNGNEFFIKLDRKPLTNEKNSIDRGVNIPAIVLGVLLAIGLLITLFLVFYVTRLRAKQRKQKEIPENMYEEMSVLLHDFKSQISNSSPKNLPRLWGAVVHKDLPLIEHLLTIGKNPTRRETGTPTSPLMEAHLLGLKEVVKIFANNLDGKQSVPSPELIKSTLVELEKRMDMVFQAAKEGIYERGNGVNVLLKTHSLPGTIKDSNGWSLIHYMAAVTFEDERPKWEPEDVRNYFENHIFYINAIDHWGNTPLHFLAKHQGKQKNTIWEGRSITVEEAWIKMAKLFARYGCDPRIPNHQNELPQDLATISGCHKLANYFKEKCEELGEINHASALNKFEDLVVAVRDNDIKQIIDLLREHVPMLPILAQNDPLVEAIRNGHRDVVFLLLCAGVPMCNCSIDDLTPLEAAHNTLGLPALFPALMQKIYSDRLTSEISKISTQDDLHKCLAEGLRNIKGSILTKGDKSRWKFTESAGNRDLEARKLLVAASGLGLSLTVQLLGLEDVELRPLPKEDSPVDKAQEGNHLDTLYALCRDLKMAHKDSMILERLESDLLMTECNMLEKYAADDKIKLLIGLDEHKVKTFLEQARNKKTSEYDWSLYEDSIFYIFARYGLIYLLKTYTKSNGTSILDKVIQKFSEATMLHISVFYGQQHITEYLLYCKASPEKKTKGGYTAAHTAAIAGHKDSMNYIISYMEDNNIATDDKCDIGLTAKELIDQYDEMRNRSNYPFLKPSDAHNVKNEIGESDMALEVLRRKANHLNIESKDHLITIIQELRQKNKQMKSSQAEDSIEETKLFFQRINNELFKGSLIECGDHCEDNMIFHDDIIRFTLELEKYTALGDSKNIQIDSQPNGDLMSLNITDDSRHNLFQENNFIKVFIEAVKETILTFPQSKSKVNLAPPFVTPYASGITLYWAWHSDSKLCLVKTYIAPVIKADLPENNGIKRFPEHIQMLCKDIFAELHVNNIKGDWTYRGYSLETQIFGNLKDNERLVWRICRFIKLISKKYWWAPTSNIRKSVQRLDVYSVGVKMPTGRTLKTLFLKELTENPEQWEKKDIFDRVIGIYRRCVKSDDKGILHSVDCVKSFLMPTWYSKSIPESVCGVIRYLEELNS